MKQQFFVFLASVTWIALSYLVLSCSGFDEELTILFNEALTPQEDGEDENRSLRKDGDCAEVLPGDSGCKNEIKRIKELLKSTPCQDGCVNEFSVEFRKSADMLRDELNKFEVKRLGKLVKVIMSDNEAWVHENIIKEAVVQLTGIRQDLADNVHLDIYKIYPELNAAPRVDTRNRQSIGEVGEWNTLNLESPVSALESKMDYFREDDSFNAFHLYWHKNNHMREPTDRSYERFSSMHRILVFRYLTGRRVEGMEDLTPLNKRNRDEVFSSEYTRLNQNGELSKWNDGTKYCDLPSSSKEKLVGFTRNLSNVLRTPSFEGYNKELETGYHNNGHNLIGESCGDMLLGESVSARMPVFWRWHLEIDIRYQQYWEEHHGTVGYNDLKPPSGITIKEAFIKSRCQGVNQAETFWSPVKGHEGSGSTWYLLDHHSVKFHIKLRNNERSKKKVIVRIFLGLNEFWKTTKWYFEMDRFVWRLTGSHEEEIIRDENMSGSSFNEKHTKCGLPQHLYLPKGRYRKSVKYRMLVFVNDVDQDVNEGEDETLKSVMCGFSSLDGIQGHTDDREFGFPLARPWEGNIKNRILSNHDRKFGKVSTIIRIVHTGLKTDQCDPGLFGQERYTTTPTSVTTTRPTYTRYTTTRPTYTRYTTTRPTYTRSTTTRPTYIRTTTTRYSSCSGIRENETCYWTSEKRVNKRQARRFCKINGGVIPKIREVSRNVLNQLRNNGKQVVWGSYIANGQCKVVGMFGGAQYMRFTSCNRRSFYHEWQGYGTVSNIFALCKKAI